MDEIRVNNEETAFREVKRAIERLYGQGYKKVDIRTSEDENGNLVISVTPKEDLTRARIGFSQR